MIGNTEKVTTLVLQSTVHEILLAGIVRQPVKGVQPTPKGRNIFAVPMSYY